MSAQNEYIIESSSQSTICFVCKKEIPNQVLIHPCECHGVAHKCCIKSYIIKYQITYCSKCTNSYAISYTSKYKYNLNTEQLRKCSNSIAFNMFAILLLIFVLVFFSLNQFIPYQKAILQIFCAIVLLGAITLFGLTIRQYMMKIVVDFEVCCMQTEIERHSVDSTAALKRYFKYCCQSLHPTLELPHISLHEDSFILNSAANFKGESKDIKSFESNEILKCLELKKKQNAKISFSPIDSDQKRCIQINDASAIHKNNSSSKGDDFKVGKIFEEVKE